jgi:hypothetical protein
MGKILVYLTLIVLIMLLSYSAYFIYDNFPREPTAFESFKLNESYASGISLNATQFYPNMRFVDRTISFEIEPACDESKLKNIRGGLNVISEKTSLRFFESKNNPQITYYCSEIAPDPSDESHFVAGEGGPTDIVNASRYSVILKAKVSLFRPERCDEPKISVHETLHALGFEHMSSKESVMYPLTDCSQKLDESIIEELNRLYKGDSLPDLGIEQVSAVKKGKYIDFMTVIMNKGLKDSAKSGLEVYGDGTLLDSFDIGELEVGSRKFLNISNMLGERSINELKFVIKEDEADLGIEDNEAVISLA